MNSKSEEVGPTTSRDVDGRDNEDGGFVSDEEETFGQYGNVKHAYDPRFGKRGHVLLEKLDREEERKLFHAKKLRQRENARRVSILKMERERLSALGGHKMSDNLTRMRENEKKVALHTHTKGLWAGASVGNIDAVQIHKKLGGNASWRNSVVSGKGLNAVQEAARKGHTNIVSFLMEHEENSQSKKVFGNAALIEAAKSGRTDVLKYLIEIERVKVNPGVVVLASQNEGASVCKFLTKQMKSEKSSPKKNDRTKLLSAVKASNTWQPQHKKDMQILKYQRTMSSTKRITFCDTLCDAYVTYGAAHRQRQKRGQRRMHGGRRRDNRNRSLGFRLPSINNHIAYGMEYADSNCRKFSSKARGKTK